jgi:dihydroorotate dehydrogenase
LAFPNPVGLAAGFDKAGRWYNELSNLGFGCIEIGTVTGQAQPGNPKPRLFRLPPDKAIVNRMGFNSDGCEFVAAELKKKKKVDCVLGINIGKSKVVPLEDAPAEYQKSFCKLFPFADYFTINVSSPNTPNLRELQNRDHLIDIVTSVQSSNEELAIASNTPPKPILLKIAPDLTSGQIQEIAEVATQCSLSAVIATNTTISRDGLKTSTDEIERIGAGGLSGAPLKARSLEVVAELYSHLQGRIPIVGVGGISTGEDAWNMICAGANLIQLYTGFIYGGPSIVRNINRELLSRLESHGYSRISDAVGKQ